MGCMTEDTLDDTLATPADLHEDFPDYPAPKRGDCYSLPNGGLYALYRVVVGCPFVAVPTEYAAYGASGRWAFLVRRDAVNEERSLYVPYDELVRMLISGEAVSVQ